MSHLQVYLDGPALSGRSETMRHIGGQLGPPQRWEYGRTLRLCHAASFVHLELRCRVNPTLWYDLVDDADREPAYTAQRNFIAATDVVIFVVDSQRERLEAGVRYFEHLRDVFTRLGRDPEEVPMVFQLNKRDLPNVAAEAELRALFQSPRSAYVATIARHGHGIPAVVAAAVELGGAASLPDRRGVCD